MISQEVEVEIDKLIEEQGLSYMSGVLFKNNFIKQCAIVKKDMISKNTYSDENFVKFCLYSLDEIKKAMLDLK